MISKKDMVILSHLRSNARQKVTEIASKTGIPVSTVHDRIRVHEKRTIKRHTSLLDFAKLGFNARVNIAIKANKGSKEELQEFLAAHSSTNTLYRVNHSFDFLGEFIFRELADAHNFAEMLENNFNAEVHLMNVIEEIRKEEFLANGIDRQV